MSFHTGDKSHNYFYRITNQINWKFYYGIHSTNNLNDGYMGSSKLLKESMNKHGKENFVLTIIQDYSTRKEASDHERLAVTSIQVNDQQCYNVRTGGDNEFGISNELRQYLSIKAIGRKRSLEECLRISERMTGKNNPFYGKHHSEESKQLIRDANSGENSFNFGRKFSEEHKKAIGDGNRGKIISDETRKKMSLAQSGKKLPEKRVAQMIEYMINNNPRSRKCSINDIEFVSIAEAARHFNISNKIARNRIISDKEEWSSWKFIPKTIEGIE